MPEFGAFTATRNIAENSAAETNVGAVVAATDLDTGDSLTYSLTSTDASSFTIDNTGQIKVGATTTLDYESAKNTYTVVVQVTDGKKADGTTDTAIDDIIVVTIKVTDVDEDGTVTLSMTQPSARTPITATLNDPDSGVTGESWQWAKASTAQGSYTNITNATSATYTPVNEDVGSYLRATVSYEDTHGQNKTAEAVSDYPVQAGANRAPTFTAGPTTRAVNENSVGDLNVGSPVTATDLDTGTTLQYSLEGTDKDSFKIVSGGQIQTKSGVSYDFETKSNYSVTVKADDGNGGTATKAVTITLNNVEEAETVRLSPTQPVAHSEVTATLTDPDGNISGTSWLWQRSSNGNTGWTNVGTNSPSYTPPDADLTYYLRATATYTDGQGASKTATGKTAAAIQSGTNCSPTFDDGLTTTREVAENSTATANVGAVVRASDLDGDTPLTYSLTGADASSFTVDNTGQIKVGAETILDYEAAKNNYTVIVQVHDGKNPSGGANTAIDDVIVVTINVTNVEEDGTVTLSMTHPSARADITASITDPDGGVTNESWQWAKSATAQGSYTDITNATSATYRPPDEDVGSYLKAKVTYDDDEGNGRTAEAASDNSVQAGANRAPTFASGPVTRAVDENSGADVNVGSPVTATDLDTGNTLSYALEGTDKDSFKIVSNSGQIQTKSGMNYDFETKRSYSVTVKADDSNGGTATKVVTTTLNDVEEAGTVSLSATQPKARAQLTATLTDPDGGVTDTTWVWEKSEDPDDLTNHPWETISNATAANYTPVDGDVREFLKATATYEDRRGAGKTAEAVSDNAVGTGSNRAPEFDGTTTTREFPENTVAGQDIGTAVKATDADNDVLEYTLEGTDAASFQIVNTSGQIQTKTGVTYNHEDKDSYSVTVKADDKKGGTDTIDVTINVIDVNEKPTFPSSEQGLLIVGNTG